MRPVTTGVLLALLLMMQPLAARRQSSPQPQQSEPSPTPAVPSPALEPVVPSPALEPVVPSPALEPVVPSPALEPVVPSPALEPVVPSALEQPVVVPTLVVPSPALEPVVPSPALEPVVPSPALEPVVPSPPLELQVPSPALEPVLPSPALELQPSPALELQQSPALELQQSPALDTGALSSSPLLAAPQAPPATAANPAASPEAWAQPSPAPYDAGVVGVVPINTVPVPPPAEPPVSPVDSANTTSALNGTLGLNTTATLNATVELNATSALNATSELNATTTLNATAGLNATAVNVTAGNTTTGLTPVPVPVPPGNLTCDCSVCLASANASVVNATAPVNATELVNATEPVNGTEVFNVTCTACNATLRSNEAYNGSRCIGAPPAKAGLSFDSSCAGARAGQRCVGACDLAPNGRKWSRQPVVTCGEDGKWSELTPDQFQCRTCPDVPVTVEGTIGPSWPSSCAGALEGELCPALRSVCPLSYVPVNFFAVCSGGTGHTELDWRVPGQGYCKPVHTLLIVSPGSEGGASSTDPTAAAVQGNVSVCLATGGAISDCIATPFSGRIGDVAVNGSRVWVTRRSGGRSFVDVCTLSSLYAITDCTSHDFTEALPAGINGIAVSPRLHVFVSGASIVNATSTDTNPVVVCRDGVRMSRCGSSPIDDERAEHKGIALFSSNGNDVLFAASERGVTSCSWDGSGAFANCKTDTSMPAASFGAWRDVSVVSTGGSGLQACRDEGGALRSCKEAVQPLQLGRAGQLGLAVAKGRAWVPNAGPVEVRGVNAKGEPEIKLVENTISLCSVARFYSKDDMRPNVAGCSAVIATDLAGNNSVYRPTSVAVISPPFAS